MKICFMNDFQSSLNADIYIACLPAERPILHPSIILPKNRFKVLEVSKQIFNNQNHPSDLHGTNKKKDLNPLSIDTLRANFSIEEFYFDWKHCNVFNLYSALSETLEEKLETEKWSIISFGEDEAAIGMWIFKKQKPVLYIPLGTLCSMTIDAHLEKSWDLKKHEISLITLKNYFEVLINQKTIFELDIDSPDSLQMLALIRFLMGDSLVYGFADSIENLKHLKFFNFLTHDTPSSAKVTLSQLEKKLSPLIATLNVPTIISKHDASYLKKHS